MGCFFRRITVALGLAAGVLFFTADASASGCNLYTASASCTFNAGVYNVVGPHPTGTGVIDSFLRVQQKGAEEGFNTGARPMLCDGRSATTRPTRITRETSCRLRFLIVNIGGTDYRAFYLDINEPAGGIQELSDARSGGNLRVEYGGPDHAYFGIARLRVDSQALPKCTTWKPARATTG